MKIDTTIRNYYNSNEKALAFGSLMYWANKNPDGFYKFKFPCKHPLYRKGDSWSETLGLTKRKLESTFSGLVTHHKSKNDYRKSEDKFAGKMFCSYTERNTNKTFYFMDKERVDEFLSSLSLTGPLPHSEISSPSEPPINRSLETSRGAHVASPLVRARQKPINTQTITSISEEEKSISKEMVDIWNSHMGDSQVWYPSTAPRLYKTLRDFFKGCLENFKNYCKATASSLFLTGKSQSKFRAFFFWAIKPETIQSILRGAYGVKNFFTMSDPLISKLKNDLSHINNQEKLVDKAIEHHEKEIRQGQKQLVKEMKASLPKERLYAISRDSKRDFYKKYPAHKGFDDKGTELLLRIHGEGFLHLWCMDKLGLSDSIAIPQELLDEKASLAIERLLVIGHLNELYAKKRGLKDLILSQIQLSNI